MAKGAKKDEKTRPRTTINICRNRRATHEYEILDRIECGLVLVGTEVKSLRDGLANLEDAYARIDERRGLAHRRGDSRVPLRQPAQSQAEAAAQAAPASPRDRSLRGQGLGEGADAGSAADVLQGGARRRSSSRSPRASRPTTSANRSRRATPSGRSTGHGGKAEEVGWSLVVSH